MSKQVHVRKARAGTDSAGHHWPEDGVVIEVDVEHALVLTRIPDGGFDIVEAPEAAGTEQGRPATARATRAKTEDGSAAK